MSLFKYGAQIFRLKFKLLIGLPWWVTSGHSFTPSVITALQDLRSEALRFTLQSNGVIRVHVAIKSML